MRKIDLFTKPLSILESGKCKTMMVREELAFICALLREKRPKKIVEVGVAHGGTTSVILECLRYLGDPVEMHSIDLAEDCAFDITKKTGYVINDFFPVIPSNINFTLHLGTILPKEIEKIGEGIDFLLLDSIHIIPGEILDYITALPFLHEGSVVVLHDILLHQYGSGINSICTRVLYETAVGEKLIADYEGVLGLPNIGAFEITKDSYKYIERCFSLLSLTWGYDLSESMEADYRNIYIKHYDNECVELYEKALSINRKRFSREIEEEKLTKTAFLNLREFVENGKRIVLYGAGNYAVKMTEYLSSIGKKVDAYIISDQARLEDCKIKENVYHASELPMPKAECSVLISIFNPDDIKASMDFSDYRGVFPGKEDFYEGIIRRLEVY